VYVFFATGGRPSLFSVSHFWFFIFSVSKNEQMKNTKKYFLEKTRMTRTFDSIDFLFRYFKVEFIPDPNSNLLSSDNNHGFSDGWTGINWEYRDQTRYRHFCNLPIGKKMVWLIPYESNRMTRVNVVNVIWNLWIHTAWFLWINNCINNWINKTKNNRAKQYKHCYQYTVVIFPGNITFWKHTILETKHFGNKPVWKQYFRGYDTV